MQRKPSNTFVRHWIGIGLLASLPLPGKEKPPAPPPPPPRLVFHGQAAGALNRDPAGHPLSVVVRVYQLKDQAEFGKLSYDLAASSRPEAELLGQDYLGKCEFTLVPGGTLKATELLLPDTQYVGMVALFRQPDRHHWRCLVRVEQPRPAPPELPKGWLKRKLTRKPKPLPPFRNPELSFKVEECYLRLLQPEAEPIPGQESFRPDCAPEPGASLQAAR